MDVISSRKITISRNTSSRKNLDSAPGTLQIATGRRADNRLLHIFAMQISIECPIVTTSEYSVLEWIDDMNRSIKGPDEKSFSEVEYERRFRLLMDSMESDHAVHLFFTALDLRFHPGSESYEKIISVWNFASGIDYRHGSTPKRIYLNHPLRVASILLQDLPSVSGEAIIIALLHNVLEVSAIPLQEIRERFGSPVACAIEALTITRGRMDRAYLEEYYSRIESVSSACAAVKAADKLDNIYMLCFNPSENIRKTYLDEIDEWVIPLASRAAPALEFRLTVASRVMRELGFLDRDSELEIAKMEISL